MNTFSFTGLIRPFIIGCVIAFSVVISVASQEYDGKGKWIHHVRQAPQGEILSIYALPDNKVWVDTEKGFHTFDGRKWHLEYFDSERLGDDPPFIKSDDGIFYFINDRRLHTYNLNDGTVSSYDSDTLRFPVTGAFSSNGDLYIASYDALYGGLYLFSNGTVSKLLSGKTRSVAVDSHDRIWITHIYNGDDQTMKILRSGGDGWIDESGNIAEIYNPIVDDKLTVTLSPDSSIWVNNEGDFAVYADGSWTIHDGGSNVAPRYLSFDYDGNAWGYVANKLYRLQEDYTWEKTYTCLDGIGSYPWFMAATNDGNIWITDDGSLYQYTPDVDSLWAHIESPYDLSSDVVTTLAYTEDNKLVCGHGVRNQKLNKGISILDGREWLNYRKKDTTVLDNVYDMVVIWNDEILTYSDIGLRLFDGVEWSIDDSIHVYGERDMLLDESGILWMGSFDGLIRYDFDVRPDTLWAPYEDHDQLWALGYNKLFEDRYGFLYMQNDEGYIIRYDETAVKNQWDGLLSNILITDFVVDPNDIIWATHVHTNRLSMYRGENTWEPVVCAETNEEIILEDASFCDYDDEDRLWASGNGNTGYLDENGVWHRIPELSQGGASEWAWSHDGRLAFNAFRVLDNGEKEYYGVYEYRPDSVISDVDEDLAGSFVVTQNFPNPFNATTLIPFELYATERVEITVYNAVGQKVRTLLNSRYPAGKHAVQWNAQNDYGEVVGSGIYFYRIHTPNNEGIGKMIYLR